MKKTFDMKEYQKRWYEEKKTDPIFTDKRRSQFSDWYVHNKDKRKEYRKEYAEKNKDMINTKRRLKSKLRRKEDPKYKLRAYISNSINRQLAKSGTNKMGSSCLAHLPFTMEDLKKHLEAQFEPWMSWGNRGKYNSRIWNDNDPTIWTWQIDHIIPHSSFHYASMVCSDFEKCWELNNLRPISAKNNILKGAK